MAGTTAVFLPNWIGDVVMATPTLRNLRTHLGPNARMIGIAKPYIREVLSGNSWLDDMIWFDRKSKDKSLGGRSVIRQLREAEVDTALMLTNSMRSAWLAWRGGIKNRVGYVRNLRGPLLTVGLQPAKHLGKYEAVSAVDYYLQLLTATGIQVRSRQPELYTTARGELAADAVWQEFEWENYHTVIALNTGGAFGAAKHWPNQHSAQLALKLARDGHRVLIMCGPKEVDAAREIQDLARHPFVRSMADQDLSIEASKACLRRSTLLVSTDSGPRHIGSAFDVPTVTLFGPIDPAWSYNYASHSIEMFDRLDCSPCGKRVCPLGHHRCMNDLTPDRVHNAVNALLGQADAEQAA